MTLYLQAPGRALLTLVLGGALLLAGACEEDSSVAAGQDVDGTTDADTSSSSWTLTSPLIDAGGVLPEALKCERDGGGGDSPPLEWTTPPTGTLSLAVVMEHYSTAPDAAVETPSHYWLLWNIPAATTSLSTGNVEGIGNLGGNKDMSGATEYTAPCSPSGGAHSYTIRIYALSAEPTALGASDDPTADWSSVTEALAPLTLGTSELVFTN